MQRRWFPVFDIRRVVLPPFLDSLARLFEQVRGASHIGLFCVNECSPVFFACSSVSNIGETTAVAQYRPVLKSVQISYRCAAVIAVLLEQRNSAMRRIPYYGWPIISFLRNRIGNVRLTVGYRRTIAANLDGLIPCR
jgi:hypothetical protein